jgi:hypothetical protein
MAALTEGDVVNGPGVSSQGSPVGERDGVSAFFICRLKLKSQIINSSTLSVYSMLYIYNIEKTDTVNQTMNPIDHQNIGITSI